MGKLDSVRAKFPPKWKGHNKAVQNYNARVRVPANLSSGAGDDQRSSETEAIDRGWDQELSGRPPKTHKPFYRDRARPFRREAIGIPRGVRTSIRMTATLALPFMQRGYREDNLALQ